MAIKGAKTIAEYAIRKWLEQEGFAVECFELVFTKNEAPCYGFGRAVNEVGVRSGL